MTPLVRLTRSPTLRRIDVDKSSYHRLSRNEIDGDNPCYQHLSRNPAAFRFLSLHAPCQFCQLLRLYMISYRRSRRQPKVPLSASSGQAIESHRMIRKGASVGRIVAQSIVFLLLCGIVGGELPELLTLADNAANDFTICKVKTLGSHDFPEASRAARTAVDIDSSRAVSALLYSRRRPSEQGSLLASGAVILHPVLRT